MHYVSKDWRLTEWFDIESGSIEHCVLESRITNPSCFTGNWEFECRVALEDKKHIIADLGLKPFYKGEK